MTDRTDEEVVDLIRSWLRQYGLTVVGGLALGVAGILGYQWWQNSQASTGKRQAAQITAMQNAVEEGNVQEARNLYDALGGDQGEMAAMAGMVLAKAYIQSGDYTTGKDLLNHAMQSKDIFIAQTAQWHLTQLAAMQGQWDEVLQYADQLQTSMYAAPALEMKSLAYRAQNDTAKALSTLEDAHSRVPNPFLEVQIQALKLQLMNQGSSS